MAWERRGKQRYFYRSVRVGGKVKKKYFGRGLLAVVAAEGMEVSRLERERMRDVVRVQREEYQQADALLGKLAEAAGSAAGHQIDRGARVRPRPTSSMEIDTMATTTPSSPPLVAPTARATPTDSGGTACDPDRGMAGSKTESPEGKSAQPADDTFKSLVQKANGGDSEALGRLRSILDENPEVWRRAGNLALHARMSLVRMIAAGDKLLFESIERKATEMESELLGPSPSPLERLSVERVVASWLQLQYADTMCAAATRDNLSQIKFWSQHQDRAHRRYQSAVRQLLATRKLVAKPAKREREVESVAGSPETTGTRHAGPVTKPLPEEGNGNGKRRGSRSGNGQAPKPVDGPKGTNGEPINRILMFSQAGEVATSTD